MNTINELKQRVRELRLDDKYSEIMRNNCIKMMDAHDEDEEGRYYKDKFGDIVDKYDPDNYDIILYIIRDGDRIYTGNQQIPTDDEHDNTTKTRELINYWFRGENSTFNILHQFSNIHNKSIGQRGGGCNQLILNKVKMEVMPVIKSTMNVNNIGVDTDIKNLYGTRISTYKREVKKEFTSGIFDIYMLGHYIKRIMDDIVRNTSAWYDMLYRKNRYWLISENVDDTTERNKFIWQYATIYDNNIDDERRYMMTLTIMKDILLYETFNYIQWKKCNWINVREYFAKIRCKDVKMYSDKLMFNNDKAVSLAFSAKYKSVDTYERNKYNKKLRDFMRDVTKQINNDDKK